MKQRPCTPHDMRMMHAQTFGGVLATSARADGLCMTDVAKLTSTSPCAAAPSARRVPLPPAPRPMSAHAAAPSPCHRARTRCRRLRLQATRSSSHTPAFICKVGHTVWEGTVCPAHALFPQPVRSQMRLLRMNSTHPCGGALLFTDVRLADDAALSYSHQRTRGKQCGNNGAAHPVL